jgi:hypothetical protein
MRPTVLPIREPPFPDESLTGFVRRHVLGMGYESFARLLSIIEGERFPRQLENLTDRVSLTDLAILLRREPEELVAMTVHRRTGVAEQQDRTRGEDDDHARRSLADYFDPSRRRVCVACLAEQPAQEKLSWLLRPLAVCPEHGVLLLDRCPMCDRALLAPRLELTTCRCGASLSLRPSEKVGAAALEIFRTIRGWFDGERLASLDLQGEALFRWLARLHVAVEKTPDWIARTRLELDLLPTISQETVAWSAAAQLLRTWPRDVTEFLDEFQESESSTRPSTRIGRAFSRLLGDAERLESSGYATPAETLREYLLSRYTRGHLSGKGSLFRSAAQRRRIAERPWISQTSAARMLKLRPPTVAELVRRNVLQGRIRVSGGRGRTNGVVSRESVVEYRHRLESALTVKQVAEQLGIACPRVLDLIRADVLTAAVRGPGGWRIPADVVTEILERLRQLPVNPPGDWIPLSEALRRFGVGGLSLTRILQLLIADEISARRKGDTVTLASLCFSVDELRRHSRAQQIDALTESGYALIQLGRMLFPGRPLRPIVLRKWIAAGLLRGARDRKSWNIAAEEVARFRASYCLAREACSLLNIARSTLDVWQRRKQLVPIYSRLTHPGAGTPVYLRADVERLAASRAA